MSDKELSEASGPLEALAWPTVLEEGFAAAPEKWSFAATASTPPLRFDAPGLVVTLPGGETSVAAYWCEKKQFTDFALSVTITLLSAQEPTQSYSGVSFRARSDTDNYRLFIDGDGYYRLTRRVDNASTALIDWTPSPALRAGCGHENRNRIQIVAEGSSLTVLANGTELAKITDMVFTKGYIALQAQGGSKETESATVFSFQDLEISEP